MQKLLRNFIELTTVKSFRNRPAHGVLYRIKTTGQPVTSRFRRLHPAKLKVAKAEFDLMLLIRPSNSSWSLPLHMHRMLNKATVADRHPLPYLQDFSQMLDGCSVFSKIDLVKAFHHIAIHPDDICKTAITTPFGLFEFVRMSFGLQNAPQTFQRFMNNVLHDLPFVFCYIDDILIASRTEDEHIAHLRQVFERLSSNGLTINVAKCMFAVSDTHTPC